MYPEIYNLTKFRNKDSSKKPFREDRFRCLQCSAEVYTQPLISGVQNRNHCPYCLSSCHVDYVRAGDRLSACKAIMQPIGLTVKPTHNKYNRSASGELMLIHRCRACGKLSINRLAADDLASMLMDIFYISLRLQSTQLQELEQNGIRLLSESDSWLVERQLEGITSQ
jgi:hypothetical protein